ncbi:hypothetical protein ScPMuIL_006097 [Solemya velum]
MPALKKALQFSFRGRRYGVLETKENVPEKLNRNDRRKSESDFRKRQTKMEEDRNRNTGGNLRRSTSSRLSLRDAFGTIRQRLRTSTRRRLRLKDTSSAVKTPPRRSPRHTAKMYSPFDIDTPGRMPPMGRRGNPKWRDAETPTRLRREVEALTCNLQALSTLTPNTLRERAMTRRSPHTSGSIQKRKSPRCVQKTQARRRIETTVY